MCASALRGREAVRVVEMIPLLVLYGYDACQAAVGLLWCAPGQTLGMSAYLSFRTYQRLCGEGCEYKVDICLASGAWLGRGLVM